MELDAGKGYWIRFKTDAGSTPPELWAVKAIGQETATLANSEGTEMLIFASLYATMDEMHQDSLENARRELAHYQAVADQAKQNAAQAENPRSRAAYLSHRARALNDMERWQKEIERLEGILAQ